MAIPVVLASGSPYRRQLLARLGIDCECIAPDIDEKRLDNESASDYVSRLALEKAQTVAKLRRHALIVAADQVAQCGNRILGKPANHDDAVRQLLMLSGSCTEFLSALVVLDSATGRELHAVDRYFVHFRELTPTMVENYLVREPAYDCAGAFKSEGFGVVLVRRFEGNDPTSLIGLPLVRLVDMLERLGLPLV